MFAAAIKAAGRVSAAVSGVKVSIVRGADRVDDVPCGLGTSNFVTVQPDGAIVNIRSQDFLILAELYDFGDGPVEPARGDQFIRCEDDGEHTYELLDLPNEHSWRWSDPWRQRVRLHTKQIAIPA